MGTSRRAAATLPSLPSLAGNRPTEMHMTRALLPLTAIMRTGSAHPPMSKRITNCRVVAVAAVTALFASSGCTGTGASSAALARSGPAPRSGFIMVTNGVRLHYVDWGGSGEPVLLLPGLFGTAEIYSDFAPRLTDRFRVLALTLRGHGQSDEPKTGYEPDSLVEDIRAFLDSMRIGRTHLVGHSLSGAELTAFAGRYPERVLKLVYLDAAYDWQLVSRFPADPVRDPEPSQQDLASPEAYLAFVRRDRYWAPVWSAPVEAQLRASLVPAPGGGLRAKPSGQVLGKFFEGAFAAPPRYELVRAPVLSIYALRDTLPDFPPDTPRAIRDSAIARHRAYELPFERASINELRRALPGAKVVELRDTHHHLFLQRRDEIVRLVRDFLLAR